MRSGSENDVPVYLSALVVGAWLLFGSHVFK